MSIRNKIKREFEVAFAKNAQPAWKRILKYLILGFIIYLFWGKGVLAYILIPLFIIALAIHFWYRFKTNAWTKSFGGWKLDKEPTQAEEI
jgi:hypothetical protein